MIIGQEALKRDILVAFFAGGHILLEGAPGLAKTKTIETFARCMSLHFQRIQFTPDLLPSDLIGAKIYDPESKSFHVKKGPIFAELILADEINRAPSKVQSALLEAMEEKQVTIGDTTFPLQVPFMVLATQNPLEQEGTFRLPEAQMDRFLLKTLVDYPSQSEEREILSSMEAREEQTLNTIFHKKELLEIKKTLSQVQVSESIYDYINDMVRLTRDQNRYSDIAYGASPRAGLALLKCSRVLAGLRGRNFVLPEDVKDMAYGVLRHRIILTYEALALGRKPEDTIKEILESLNIL